MASSFGRTHLFLVSLRKTVSLRDRDSPLSLPWKVPSCFNILETEPDVRSRPHPSSLFAALLWLSGGTRLESMIVTSMESCSVLVFMCIFLYVSFS